MKLQVSHAIVIFALILQCYGAASNITAAFVAGSKVLNKVSVYTTNPLPGARVEHCVTSSATKLYVMGGFSQGATGTSSMYLNDVWQLDLTLYKWTLLAGDAVPASMAVYSAMGVENATSDPGPWSSMSCTLVSPTIIYAFGGIKYGGFNSNMAKTNELWTFNVTSKWWTWWMGDANSPWTGVSSGAGSFAPDNIPGPRSFHSACATSSPDELYIMGGDGYSRTGIAGLSNEVWLLNTTTKMWAWISGTGSQLSVSSFGQRLVESSTNMPSSRKQHSMSFDPSSRSFFIYAGAPIISGTAFLGDVWRFNLTSWYWTWMGGHKVNTQVGNVTNFGEFSAAGIPSSRSVAASGYLPVESLLFVYGGYGAYTLPNGIGTAAYLNDAWVFHYPTNQWAWIGGNFSDSLPAVYVATATEDPYPGGRSYVVAAPIMNNSTLYLFGGRNKLGFLADCWKLKFNVTAPPVLIQSSSAAATSSAPVLMSTSMMPSTTVLASSSANVAIIASFATSLVTTAAPTPTTTAAAAALTSKSASLGSSRTLTPKLSSSINLSSSITTSTLSSNTDNASTSSLLVATPEPSSQADMAQSSGVVAGLFTRTDTLAALGGASLLLIVSVVVGVLLCRRRSLQKQDKEHRLYSTNNLVGESQSSLGQDGRTQVRTVGQTSSDYRTVMPDQTEFSLPGFLQFQANVDFKWTDLIARGGGGQLFRGQALNPKLAPADTVLVVKIIGASRRAVAERLVTAFEQEISVMHYLGRHPNIVRLLGWCEQPLAMIMKLYTQGTVANWIESRLICTKTHQLSFLRDITNGLQFMHDKDVAHFDLKPANVLIDTDEERRPFCVLTDFGISQIFNTQAGLVKKFEVVNLKGMSLMYAAPESIKKFRQGGPRQEVTKAAMFACDIYALAIIINEIVTVSSVARNFEDTFAASRTNLKGGTSGLNTADTQVRKNQMGGTSGLQTEATKLGGTSGLHTEVTSPLSSKSSMARMPPSAAASSTSINKGAKSTVDQHTEITQNSLFSHETNSTAQTSSSSAFKRNLLDNRR